MVSVLIYNCNFYKQFFSIHFFVKSSLHFCINSQVFANYKKFELLRVDRLKLCCWIKFRHIQGSQVHGTLYWLQKVLGLQNNIINLRYKIFSGPFSGRSTMCGISTCKNKVCYRSTLIYWSACFLRTKILGIDRCAKQVKQVSLMVEHS